MTEESILANIGELSKPATVLIEKVSDAIGGICKPWQIKRVATAEADAKLILAKSDIEVTELQQRAMGRFFVEEAQRQANIESITAKSIPQISESANPDEMDNDWIVNFFDKARLVSDFEMQELWSTILAGEANSPQSFSKRIVNIVAELSKSEAKLFQKICRYGWKRTGADIYPLIYDYKAKIYKAHGIDYSGLRDLASIGLISLESSHYRFTKLRKRIVLSYYENRAVIEFDEEQENTLQIGYILLTSIGQELARICNSPPIPGFYDYIIDYWRNEKNLSISYPEK